MKIILNKEKCIGCGSCESVCSKLFELKEGKSHLKNSKAEEGKEILEIEDPACAREAKDICPGEAIEIE